MSRKKYKRFLVVNLTQISALFVAHYLLIRVLADRHVVDSIFAAGDQVRFSMLAVAGLFVAARLLAVLILPGLVACRLGQFLICAMTDRSCPLDDKVALR